MKCILVDISIPKVSHNTLNVQDLRNTSLPHDHFLAANDVDALWQALCGGSWVNVLLDELALSVVDVDGSAGLVGCDVVDGSAAHQVEAALVPAVHNLLLVDEINLLKVNLVVDAYEGR